MPSPAAWSRDLWWQQDQWSYSVEISQFSIRPVWEYRVKTQLFSFYFIFCKAEWASKISSVHCSCYPSQHQELPGNLQINLFSWVYLQWNLTPPYFAEYKCRSNITVVTTCSSDTDWNSNCLAPAWFKKPGVSHNYLSERSCWHHLLFFQ